MVHILHMPDAEQRRQYAIALAEELAQFERPMPVMDEYDLLLADAAGGDPMKNQTESSRTGQRAAVLQGGARAGDRGQLRIVGRAGREGEP